MNNLRSVDLNLLVILDALLQEAHVTRAAARLHLSQPATSSALDRLRHLFGDKLLERGTRGMRLTPAAEALRPPLAAVLAAAAALVQRPDTDLAAMRQTVRLVMADVLAAAMLPDLHARLAGSAPGVTLAVLHWQGGAQAVRQLAAGEADLVASVLPPLGPAFRKAPLGGMRYRVAMRREHPAADGFGLEPWLAYPHVVVSGDGNTATALDAALAMRGLSRRVGVVAPSFLLVPPLLRGSELIALLPDLCVTPQLAETLVSFAPPVDVDGFHLDLAWHSRRDRDPVVQHVAGEIRALLAGLGLHG